MYIWPNGHSPENLCSRMDTCQNVPLAKWTFLRKPIFHNGHLPECTFGQMDVSPKTYFPEWTFARMYIWPNGYFHEKLFSRMDTCQNVHLMLAIITQDDEIKLFCSVSRVNICFITEKFDVLRDRLLGNHNDFHWQLGGQINHQPCSCKAARVKIRTELDSAVLSF